MSILGVIVRAHPADADRVQAALRALPGLDVAARDGSRFVVVIEDSDRASAADVMTRITQLPQVLNTALVYEYSGPDSPPPAGQTIDFKSWRGDRARA